MEEAPTPKRGLVIALVGAWVCISALCVMLNKHILFYLGFKFPTTLAVMHMLSAFAVASGFIHLSPDGRQHLPHQEKMGGYFHVSLALTAMLFGFVLVLSNSAFLYLSVPAIQMLKAAGCATTFIVGLCFGNEVFKLSSMGKVAIVGSGVVIASYGDITANLWGIALQMSAIVCDAVRCNLLQMAMQRNTVKLTPVGTLYYVTPLAAAALSIPAVAVEGQRLLHHDRPTPYLWLLGSCVAAACLNLIVFTLIGKTSALTTSIIGPLKEWVCILVSMALYGTIVRKQQWFGYAIALCGIFWYQRDKFFTQAASTTVFNGHVEGASGTAAEEKLPLVQPLPPPPPPSPRKG